MSSVMAVARGVLIVAALTWCSLVDAADAPMRADLPTVPYEEHGACPFECCTYRVWTVEADTDVRTDRRDNASVAFRLRKGDHVEGLTGVVITRKLGKAIVRESVIMGPDQLKLNPGDTVYVLNYLGEGAWKAWARGQFYHTEIAAKNQVCRGPQREQIQCPVQMVDEPITEWWSKVRSREGKEGWTRQMDHFGNIDACG